MTRKGYVFAGWYTSSKFDGERITEIPAGATGGYALYARWLKIFINEDYDTTGTVVNIADKNSNTFGGLIYNATQVGVSIKTTGKNDKYLVVTSTKSPAQVALSEGKYNLRTMTDTAVSYQISLRAADGLKLSKFQIYIPTRSSKLGALYVGNSGTDGSFKLTNSDVELAKITGDEWITLRITLDFAAGTVTAYDEHGNILDCSEPNVPTISDAALGAGMKQPTTLAEWQRLDGAVASDMPYLVYFYSEGEGTIYYDDIKIIEGKFFDLDRANNSIIYHTDGGALANGISTYDPVSGTDLSAVKPTKYGYIFDGWYTEDDVKVDGNVGIGQTAPVTLYAKWSVDNTVIIFNPDGGKMPAQYPTNYDIENGTDVSEIVPTKEGYVFVTWLDSEGNPVTVIGQGKTEQIALTAKWEIRPDTLYFELGGGTLATQLPKYYDANIGTIVNSADYMPTRYGYVFAGWYTDSEFTERVTEEYVPAFDKPITLYAKWEIRPDTLYAELNGGSLETNLPDFYDESLGEMLKDYVPTKPNSEFGGWYTDPSFAEKYRVTESLVVDFTAPITIYARWLLPNGSIFYETNGGALPESAPTSYDNTLDTVLPTALVRDGYVFGGWYTDARFTSERVTYIPKGALGGYQLYAKWLKVYTDEDYDSTETEVDVVGKKDMYIGNITYNATAVGVSIKTEAEGDNKYLLVTSTVASSAQVVRSGSFKTMTETAISYQISIKAVEGENLRKFSLWIPTKSSKYGTLSVATSDVSGSFKLANSTKEIAKFTSTEWTTVRVVLDFASGEAIAYDEFGNVLDRSKLTVPTLTAAALSEGIKQPTTLAEWQRLEGVDAAQFPYLIYFNSEGIGQIAFDNLKVIEGNVFDNATNAIAPHNSIKYEIGEGGKLPEGYSTIYDAVNGTNLPIPTRDCYEFLGWYLDEDCEGTSVTKVGAGQTGDRAITVYAKWRFITNTIAYNTNGGTMPNEYTVIYDKENGYDVSGVVPTLKGYRFGGWYESETFEGTRANVVGVGTDAPIALYARWYKVLAEENFERDNPEDEINVPAGENNLYGAFEYNTKNKGCSFATVTDTVTGNKYLEVTADGTATVYKSSSYNLKTMIDTAISYDITLWAIEGKAVSKFSLYLPTSGSKCGTLSIVSQDSNGNIKFNGTGEDVLIGNINDGALVLHITVDFADGYAYAFDEAGDVIAKSLLIVPTITQAAIDEGLAEGQPETLGEWQRIATNHLGHITATGLGYLAFDNVCILEGRAFSK